MRQFMNGARALRSEIVGVLKTHAIPIFGITDIPAGMFFNKAARDESLQLQALRLNNNFLYAKEGTVRGPRMAGYLRSDCIARVRLSVRSSMQVSIYFLGVPGRFAWSASP